MASMEELDNITPQGIDALKGFSVDPQGSLLYNGKKVLTEQKVVLDRWVSYSIIGTGIATSAIAIITLLQYLNH